MIPLIYPGTGIPARFMADPVVTLLSAIVTLAHELWLG